jgi:hypothetical protein
MGELWLTGTFLEDQTNLTTMAQLHDIQMGTLSSCIYNI